MKKIYYIICSLLAISCTEKDKFSENFYDFGQDFININMALKQGSQIYNEKIQNLYDKYGAVIIYEFPSGAPSYHGPTGSSMSSKKIYYTLAQEKHVGFVIELYEKLLSFIHNEDYLPYFAPRNIFIVDSIGEKEGKTEWAIASYPNKLLLGGGGEDTGYALRNNLEETSIYPRKGCQMVFREGYVGGIIERLYSSRTIPLCQEVRDLIPEDMEKVNSINAKEYGFIGSSNIYLKNPDELPWIDQREYVLEWLKLGEEEFTKKYLDAKIDKQGLIKRKLELLLDYYKNELRIDLEELGTEESLILQ